LINKKKDTFDVGDLTINIKTQLEADDLIDQISEAVTKSLASAKFSL
jgi:hypothetical protein